MRSFGWCFAIVSTNEAPSPPGDTPVVRTTLSRIWSAQASAIWSAVVSELNGEAIMRILCVD